MNAMSHLITATVVAGVILGAFGFGFNSIFDRIDRLERQVVKVLDDHEMRLRLVERKTILEFPRTN